MYLGSIIGYDKRLGHEGMAGYPDRTQQNREGTMAEEDSYCATLNKEHIFHFNQKTRFWECKCGEKLLEAQMDSIVERVVNTDSGHAMMIWPGQVKLERKRK
jgi:hypothetical protein